MFSRTEQAARDFAAIVRSQMAAKGVAADAAQLLEQRGRRDLARIVKDAVDSGGTGDSDWGSELTEYAGLAAGFLESLQGASLYDSILPVTARLPFRTRVVSVTQPMAAAKVSEHAPAPVTRLTLDAAALQPRKVSGIAVGSEELLESGTGADDFILRELRRAVVAGTDADFIGDISQGAPSVSASGDDAAAVLNDLRLLTAYLSLGAETRLFLAVHPKACAAWSLLGESWPAFVDLNITGGQFQGVRVVASAQVPAEDTAVLIDASALATASNDRLEVRISTNATIDLRDDFASGSPVRVSLFQAGCVGAIATRAFGFHLARAGAVAVLENIPLPEMETT